MVLFEPTAEASRREVQLFDHAYYAYLSYQPKEAVEEFKIFLEEFPDSSAKDAALFWLAKSLLQIQCIQEARKTFACIEEQFPESPFICYVEQEMATFDNLSKELHSVRRTVVVEAGDKVVEAGIPSVSDENTDQDRPDTHIRSEADRLQELLDRERVKTDLLQRRVNELEQRAAYVLNYSIVSDQLRIHNSLWRDKNTFADFEAAGSLSERAILHNETMDERRYRARIFTEHEKLPRYVDAEAAQPDEKDSSEQQTDTERRIQGTAVSSEGKVAVYALQVGAFKTKELAVTLCKSLEEKLSNRTITICHQGDFFKVRITGFDDIEEVNSVLKAGIDGLVIKTGHKACGI
jgi:hypothetical protein